MRLAPSISTLLGKIGVAAAVLLFYLGESVFHMDRLDIQTWMYLKLSVPGHLTIFLRARAAHCGRFIPCEFIAQRCLAVRQEQR
jgi:H+-transporting ATPase